jgi:O-acetyl-ADP-ribose deacetylase (regulator of RNase III)
MPTSFVKGDLFNTEGIRAYAHGCNCAAAMDAGVAAQFKKRWPRMFEEYVARCTDGRFHLGDVFVWNEDDVTVYNLAIQEHWKAKARIPALKKGLLRAVELASLAGVERIGVPRIGAGLGGIDWPRVRSLLEETGGVTTVTLVVFEQFVRAGKT